MIRTLNRLLDAAFRIDSHAALNDGVAVNTQGVISRSGFCDEKSRPPWTEISRSARNDKWAEQLRLAADIQRALNMLKAEAYDEKSAQFDYARVRASGTYRALRECTARLINFDLATCSARAERLAFWINLYNALVLDAVICFDVRDSVAKDLGFFRRAAYRVNGMRFSADDIEHGILRGNRHHPVFPFPQFASDDPRLAFSVQPMDPRVHAALNCASRSCPPIAVYDAEHIDAQLDQAMCAFINGSVQIDKADSIVRISPIFRWYAVDFGGRVGMLDWITRSLDDESSRAWFEANRKRVRIKYSQYDWTLSLK